jgi:hypothetical protein
MRELNREEMKVVSGGVVPDGCWDEFAAYLGATAAIVIAAPSIGGMAFAGVFWGLAAYQLEACREPVVTMVDEFGCHRVSLSS